MSTEDESREAEDAATFGDVGSASKGEMSVEITKANSRKMLLVWVLAGLVALTLMMCLGMIFLGYAYWNRKPPPDVEAIAQKKLAPPKEMKARIKNIDRQQSTMRLLVGDGKYQSFAVTNETEFKDADDRPLPKGIHAPEVREEANVVIFPTEDRQGLQWLRLTR